MLEDPTPPLRVLSRRFWEAMLVLSLMSAAVKSPLRLKKLKLPLQLQPKEPAGKRCWRSNALLAFLCGDLIIFIGDVETVRLERRFLRRGRCAWCLAEATEPERDLPPPRAELRSNTKSRFSTSLSSSIEVEKGFCVVPGDEGRPGGDGGWVLLCAWLGAWRPEEKKSEYVVTIAEESFMKTRMQFEFANCRKESQVGATSSAETRTRL